MVNYLGKFLPNLAEETAPLRILLKKENMFVMDKPQIEATKRLKDLLTSTPVLKFYNPNSATRIQIEKEILSVLFGCERSHEYVYGKTFTAPNDHMPLKSIFSKSLSQCPPRIQRFLLSLQRYEFDFEYIPGRALVVADTLSRAARIIQNQMV